MTETFSVMIMRGAPSNVLRTFPTHGWERPIRKTHLTNMVGSVWITWCEIPSGTGKLLAPPGGYKLTSLKLRHLNNLTHKRLREGCVDWKSIGCLQPHTSLSRRWHQHFFKGCNRFSLWGLYSEGTSGIQFGEFETTYMMCADTSQHRRGWRCLSLCQSLAFFFYYY